MLKVCSKSSQSSRAASLHAGRPGVGLHKAELGFGNFQPGSGFAALFAQLRNMRYADLFTLPPALDSAFMVNLIAATVQAHPRRDKAA